MKIKIVLDKSNDQGYSCVFEHLTGWSVSEAVCYHPFVKKKTGNFASLHFNCPNSSVIPH